MFIQFHQFSNGKLTLLPLHAIKYIVEHAEGGASIYTNLFFSNSDKPKIFRSKEAAEVIYKSVNKDIRLADGIFSSL